MSGGNVRTIICKRCKVKTAPVLNNNGEPYTLCEKCQRYHREYNQRYLANETAEHHTARMKTQSDKYFADEAYREHKIKVAIAYSQVDSECPVCLKK